MNWPIEEFLINDLYLDNQNIRLQNLNQDQNALIQDLFSNEQAYEIAKSIAQNGLFPDEFPIAIKEDNKVIVIEGNRRLAALKALKVPEIIPAFKQQLKKLSVLDADKIRVVIAPNRETAIKHLANKHTTDYKRPWKPLRQAYFYKSQLENGKKIEELIVEYPDHDIVRFIKMLEMHNLAKKIKCNDSLVEYIHDERNFPITNLERFYNDKNITEFLGIEFSNNGKVMGKIVFSEFEKGYKQIVEDVALGNIDSRKFNSKTERNNYISKLPKESIPNKSKVGNFSSNNLSTPNITLQKKTYPSSHIQKKPPKGLFHKKDLPCSLSNTSLRLVYTELHRIDVSKFPNATHDLLRSFLECTSVIYLKETNHYENIVRHNKHNPKLSEMLSYIKDNVIKDNNLKQTINQISSNWGSPHSLERMNMINHNENWNSSEKDVRSAWGKIENLLKHLLNPNINENS